MANVIAFSRAIGPVPISCVVSERHTSEVEITHNPIETGADVNDHAYIKPKEVVLEVGDAAAAATFNTLIQFQSSRVPFYLVTGLTVYENMLISSIDATRDKDKASILSASVTCKQVIIVSTASAPDDGSAHPSGQTGGKKSTGAANPSKQSANNSATADRAASTVQAGDNPTTTVPPSKGTSLLKQMFTPAPSTSTGVPGGRPAP
ncbi:hypothetical protein EVC26_050 [Rhizobium phage RHph_I72]|nr:hypothetical protein EVC13_048 [Rhizobium phage RHph_I65]QIG76496.1 hypothetical protein EVC26_050 [Rhizobium phage RHph_I72]